MLILIIILIKYHIDTLLIFRFQADVIMALAGSNGGSWSTSLLPNLSLKVKPSGGDDTPLSGENDNQYHYLSSF